jgi:hypothetical protein
MSRIRLDNVNKTSTPRAQSRPSPRLPKSADSAKGSSLITPSSSATSHLDQTSELLDAHPFSPPRATPAVMQSSIQGHSHLNTHSPSMFTDPFSLNNNMNYAGLGLGTPGGGNFGSGGMHGMHGGFGSAGALSPLASPYAITDAYGMQNPCEPATPRSTYLPAF